MKKYLFIPLTALFFLAFTFNVKAATYQLSDLHVGTHLYAGDIIESGTCDFDGRANDFVLVRCFDNRIHERDITRIYPNQSYTLLEDFYVAWAPYITSYFVSSNHASYHIVSMYLEKIKVISEHANTSKPQEHVMITKNPNETITLSVSAEGGTPPYSYEWVYYSSDARPTSAWGGSSFTVPEGMTCVDCVVWDSTRGVNDFSCGVSARWFINEATSEPKQENDEESDEKENNEEPSKEEVTNDIDVSTPSTVPVDTVQVTIGTDDSSFANTKVLNQFPHDSINQSILANMYAANLKKRANVLVQKNIIPPHGVSNTWKVTSHTIKWRDLNVKKGDTVVIVWYTPTFWGHTSTLKYIPATVVEDGTIEFSIPAMGDMSVMSIVKLL